MGRKRRAYHLQGSTGVEGLITAVVAAAIDDAGRGDREARAWLLNHAPGVVAFFFGVSAEAARRGLQARLSVD